MTDTVNPPDGSIAEFGYRLLEEIALVKAKFSFIKFFSNVIDDGEEFFPRDTRSEGFHEQASIVGG